MRITALVSWGGQARVLMAVMLKRWSGNVWLGWAFLFLCLTLVSTFLAFVSGFVHDPDDYPASYYRDKIPQRQWVMGLSMLFPALSAAAAGASIFARPRALNRIATGSIMLLLAVAAMWFCWALGVNDLEKFENFAISFSQGA
ncbi:hypothetical protein ACIQTW_12120 [Paenarthrobacter sp. NPDC090517]|uniref:hypothetical protein n=1 Tax=Paenarthrobacter sp. NPDC090517 TaxID=3364381 RepID=UPI0038141EE8